MSLPGGVFNAAGAGVKTNLLFFTKGKPTERIWYFDLSDIKVGKKTPFTLDKFADFFRLLPKRGDSERSWMVDIAARRRETRREADALRAQARKPEAEAAKLQEQLKESKKSGKSSPAALEKLEAKAKELSREVDELNAKAKAIEDGAFDLKAVNPNRKNEEDQRTPAELLDFLEAKGREVTEALAGLRK